MTPFKRSFTSTATLYRSLLDNAPSRPASQVLLAQRRLSSSATAHAAVRKTKRTTVAASELPTFATDEHGNKLKALPPLPGARNKATARTRSRKDPALIEADAVPPASSASSAATLRADFKAAVARGEVPDTPLAELVYENWKRFPDAIILTRVGKFYESYFAPAVEFSALLSLKLAYKRYTGGNLPFSGFPVHQLDKYLKILVQDLGRTVVLVEEYDEEGRKEGLDPMRKASAGAELKDRRVGRVVTPGTLVEESWISGDESRYLLAVAVGDGQDGEAKVSLAYTDPSTGEFWIRETSIGNIEDEIARIAPTEVVLDAQLKAGWVTASPSAGPFSPVADLFQLLRVLGVHVSFASPTHTADTAPTLPILPLSLETQAVTLLRHHLEYALRDSTPDLQPPNRQTSSRTMLIDSATLAALEIRHAIRPGGLVSPSEAFGRASPISSRGTLLSTMSQTMTPSGHRLLVRTLTAPSTDVDLIKSRLDLVESLVHQEELRTDLRDMIRGVGDVVRIIQRFKGRRGDGRDTWDVGTWIRNVDRVLKRVKRDMPSSATDGDRLRLLVESFKPLSYLAEVIEASIDEAAVMKQGLEDRGDGDDEMQLQAGDAMVAGGSAKGAKKLAAEEAANNESNRWFMKHHSSDELKLMHSDLMKMKTSRTKMERDLRKKLGIEKLRLSKNRSAFVMNITDKLDYAKIDKLRQFASIAESRSAKSYAYNPWTQLGSKMETHMENMLFAQRRALDLLRDRIVTKASDIQQNAELMDELDLSLSFAQTAADLGYVRPILDDSTNLEIVDGRHPTVEASLLNSSRSFTPNSTSMTPSSHLHIITGPNQGGKSTLLRQTAVIAILAQAGSFVPAAEARLGIVDRVFSRIGARDDLFRDRSTFMLEMVETSAILRHATERSLVIMDEIGRGTTLHSGLSIAYATLNHILTKIRCRTLFATHYHEVAPMLSAEGQTRLGVEFWCTDINENDGAFSYQYRLQKGVNHQSHAIKAARLAGMPDSFLQTAEKTLKALDAGSTPRCAADASAL